MSDSEPAAVPAGRRASVTLTVEEWNGVLAQLGEVPGKFGLVPLMAAIQQQVVAQLSVSPVNRQQRRASTRSTGKGK